jgi:uncharacterized protein YegL
MKDNYTHIAVVLDKSGSMGSVKTDTIGEFNNFLKEQKEATGEATMTLVTFNDKTSVINDFSPIKEMTGLTEESYRPDGYTALHDAVGLTINSVGKRLAEMDETKRPSSVLFIVITDGHENRSTEFKANQIKEMIDHQKGVYNWEFVFMGANQDAVLTGGTLGVKASSSMTYSNTSRGIHEGYAALSKNTIAYRADSNTSKAFCFSDADKQAQADIIGSNTQPDYSVTARTLHKTSK